MKEIWKDIVGYEGLYQVSNLGNVKSLERIVIKKDNKKYLQKEKILRLGLSDKKYYTVSLFKNGKGKTYRIHRLVAEAFIPNPNNYPCVNHKDENKQNNCIDNLEWCTNKYNLNYSDTGKLKRRKIIQYSINFEPIYVWESIKEASEKFNINYRNIISVCKGRRKTAGGFIWRYYETNI